MTTDRLTPRVTKTRILGIVAAFAALAALLVPATPADATVSGSILIACEADLPAFPSPTVDNGTCDDGTLNAAALGVGAGLDDSGNPYALAGPGDFSSTFEYSEACTVEPAGAPPLTGTADGQAVVSNAPAVHNGAVTQADLVTNFSWTRVGLTAVISTTPAQISFADGGTASGATGGVAAAVFVPLNPADDHGCPGPGDPVQAQVVAVNAEPA